MADGCDVAILQASENTGQLLGRRPEELLGQPAVGERFADRTAVELAKAARQHRVTIVGSIFEKRSAGVYHNTAVIITG